MEETSEVVSVTSETNLVEELDDVYEALRAYLDFKGIDQEHFLKVVAKNEQKRAALQNLLRWKLKNLVERFPFRVFPRFGEL